MAYRVIVTALTADKLPYLDGTGTAALADFTAFGRTLLAQSNADGVLDALGLSSFVETIIDEANAAAFAAAASLQPADAELTALAGLTSAADKLPYFTGSGTADVTTLTAAARTILDDTTVAAILSTIGGQPLDTELTALAGLTSAADKAPYFTGSGTADVMTVTAAARTVLDDATIAAMNVTLNADKTIVRVTMASDQSMTSTAEATINYDTEQLDTQGEFNTSTHVYTANATRNLRVTAMIKAAGGDSDTCKLRIYKNAGIVAETFIALSSAAGNSNNHIVVDDIVQVVANDTITIKYLEVGGTRAVTSGTTYSRLLIQEF